MLAPSETRGQHLPFMQAIELSRLVELEAQWENLRVCLPTAAGRTPTLNELHQKQKAYEAFLAKLVSYNRAHKPAHVGELLLNNASRLGGWCWSMRDLFLQIQDDTHARCPIHLLTKAYRWADRVASRMKKERIVRPAPSITIQAAIQELEKLARWCENQLAVAA